MRKSKAQVEIELQEMCNKHLPEEPPKVISKVKVEAAVQGPEEFISPVDKQSLLPKIGDDLPIDPVFVGCTKALFFEHRFQTTVTANAPYCYKPNDHVFDGVTYRSMYLIYMSCDSEYEAAIKLLGNFQHWQKLKRCTWFLPYVEEWNAEILLREAALAKSKLVTLTQNGNVTAARTLLNSKGIAGAGKPPKKGKRTSDVVPGDLEAMLERTDFDDTKPN